MKKLLQKIILSGTIKLETGLHIGGSKSSLDIGGLDSPVIKTPAGIPYIPGSSYKGKLRTLLAMSDNGSQNVENDPDDIKKLFGSTDDKAEITRLIFRDAYLDEDSFQETFEDTVLETAHTEGKTENRINRKNGKAEHPRQIERVPAGAVFNYEIVLNIFDGDDKDEFVNTLKKGFRLLEDDYLGGSGTRGYGKVTIKENPIKEKTY